MQSNILMIMCAIKRYLQDSHYAFICYAVSNPSAGSVTAFSGVFIVLDSCS